ncbi:type I polyketide synthase [Catellatospora paridis]|uniref:type I polyketide synthase n=1 Tax=Catellatospora paridis TaxID=1617086 RepID=UPI0012D37796|nr:type I polyketide synthase [Catellatospora paridis]
MTDDLTDGPEPIAVIGMACRVPGAADLARFWDNLVAGRSARTELSREHLLRAGVPAEQVDDPDFVPVGYLLDDVENFDAGLFGLTPREAALADPQHRLFLELCHAALEHAGWDPARYPGDIGVYGGRGMETYRWQHIHANRAVMAVTDHTTIGNGNHADTFTTLASYHLNLRGPSVGVYTACSTSLVAVHTAAEALRAGECDMALAGGVSIELPADRGYLHREGAADSADGHCRPFDAAASGVVAGSGGGVVLLKRLADAVDDGDHVYAVVLGNAVNNDGAAKVGFTASGVAGQAAAIANALATAGVDARTVTYVEASATGSPLGDAIEVEALTSVYGRGRADRQWCALGSVKSNIGHLSQGAGVVGLIKTALALDHGLIPASLGYTAPNPALGLDTTPFYVNATLATWESGATPRRAAVSSFGIGGTNAHVVLQQAPVRAPELAVRVLPANDPGSPQHALPSRPGSSVGSTSHALPSRPGSSAGSAPHTSPASPGSSIGRPEILTVSARSATARDTAAARLADHLATTADLNLADVAHTLRVGRAEHPYRAAVVATGVADAAAALRDPQRRLSAVAAATPRVVLLFGDQSAVPSGLGLYAAEPAFADAVDRCAAAAGRDARDLLADPLLASFTVGFAMARLWQSWGVRPATMLGHGAGEYVAATLAGVFDLSDALRLVALHGRLHREAAADAAFTVSASAEKLAALLPPQASIVAVDGPASCVVTGPAELLERLTEPSGRKIGTRRLRTVHPSPSAVTETMVAELSAAVATARPSAPSSPYLSCRTGLPVTAEQTRDPAYWAGLLREPVLFGPAIATALAGGASVFMECGPGRRLAGLAQMQAPKDGVPPLHSLPATIDSTVADPARDLVTCYTAAGRLWAHGVPLTFGGMGRRVALPGYPYERTRHWIDPDPPTPALPPVTGTAPMAAGGGPVTGVTVAAGGDTAEPGVADVLAPIWSSLLGIERIRPDDDFFAIGGTSLTAVQLVAQVRASFGVRLSMRLIFDAPTLDAMARTIEQRRAAKV